MVGILDTEMVGRRVERIDEEHVTTLCLAHTKPTQVGIRSK